MSRDPDQKSERAVSISKKIDFEMNFDRRERNKANKEWQRKSLSI